MKEPRVKFTDLFPFPAAWGCGYTPIVRVGSPVLNHEQEAALWAAAGNDK